MPFRYGQKLSTLSTVNYLLCFTVIIVYKYKICMTENDISCIHDGKFLWYKRGYSKIIIYDCYEIIV